MATETLFRVAFKRADGREFYSAFATEAHLREGLARRSSGSTGKAYLSADITKVEREVGTWAGEKIVKRWTVTFGSA